MLSETTHYNSHATTRNVSRALEITFPLFHPSVYYAFSFPSLTRTKPLEISPRLLESVNDINRANAATLAVFQTITKELTYATGDAELN